MKKELKTKALELQKIWSESVLRRICETVDFKPVVTQ